MNFEDFFKRLEYYGMLDALLPFLLVFIIIFAMLQKSNILGQGKKNFNVMVAAIIGLLVVIPHVTGTYQKYDVVKVMNESLPQVSLIAVAIIMALLLIGIMGGESKWLGGSLSGWIAIIAFGVVIYIFGASMNAWDNVFYNWFGTNQEDTMSLVVIILIFAIVVWYITRDAAADKGAKGFNLIKEFGDMFKK
jgi:hypothetical protein